MGFPPLCKKGTIALTGGRGVAVTVRPSMLVSMREGDYTCLEMLDGCKVFVKESPVQIAAMIAGRAKELLSGAAPYSRLAGALAYGSPSMAEIVSGDDDREARVRELVEAAHAKGSGSFSRLLGIYGELISHFAVFNALSFARGSREEPSSLEREIAARRYAAKGD